MLFPGSLDDYVGEDNPLRAVDVFVDEPDLASLGFEGVEPTKRFDSASPALKKEHFL